MKLPNTAHTSRPWRIHELARDFRLEDVWALPTPGGPGDFPRLVRLIASGNASRDSKGPAHALWAIRLKLGELLRWDEGPDAAPRPGPAVAPRPAARRPARGPVRPAPPHVAVRPALPDRRRVGRGDHQPDRTRDPAPRLGPGHTRPLPWPARRLRQAERPPRQRLHDRHYALPPPDRLPRDDPPASPGLARPRPHRTPRPLGPPDIVGRYPCYDRDSDPRSRPAGPARGRTGPRGRFGAA